MSLTPLQSLILLALVGLAISGWLYGLHWKRIATGDSFTKEEKVMFLLQDQIEVGQPLPGRTVELMQEGIANGTTDQSQAAWPLESNLLDEGQRQLRRNPLQLKA